MKKKLVFFCDEQKFKLTLKSERDLNATLEHGIPYSRSFKGYQAARKDMDVDSQKRQY